MSHLDADRMFDRRLARGDWRQGPLEALAATLARFFATARPARLAMPPFAARLGQELCASEEAVSAAGEPALAAILQPATRCLLSFLTRRRSLFLRRIRERRLVDGHGDLRPEHVYLNDRPPVIDCLEFSADLRQLDLLNELAYFALECRRLGGPAIIGRLLRRYRERTGGQPAPELIHFYTAVNAIVRARIALRHPAEPGCAAPMRG